MQVWVLHEHTGIPVELWRHCQLFIWKFLSENVSQGLLYLTDSKNNSCPSPWRVLVTAIAFTTMLWIDQICFHFCFYVFCMFRFYVGNENISECLSVLRFVLVAQYLPCINWAWTECKIWPFIQWDHFGTGPRKEQKNNCLNLISWCYLAVQEVFMQVFICPSNNKNIGIYIQEISKYLVTQAQLTRELLFGADM